jgi:peptide/nickel transport system substrate-binding protein
MNSTSPLIGHTTVEELAMVGQKNSRGSGRRAICGLALFFFAWSNFACATSEETSLAQENTPVTLTIGYPHITGLDPLHGLQQAARLISFEGLASLGRDGRPQPRLASSWELTSDGLAWTIRLRPNAFFHDGSLVDSSAVRRSLERSLGNADRDLSPGLADITRIDNPAPLEVVLHLRERSTFALDDLTVSILKMNESGNPIGTGPFQVTSASGNEVTMTAVERYYRGKPSIQQIVWKAYPAVRSAWAAMMRGEVDFLYEVGPEVVEFMKDETTVKIFPFLRSYVFGVIVNSNLKQFSDWRIRRALNHSVNRTTIVERALRGHGRPAAGPAWPQHWAFDSTVPNMTYDPVQAAALLDAAKFPIRPTKTGAPTRFHFTCILPENFALWERIGLLVQRDFAEVGVDMRLETVSVDEFNRRIGTGTYEAVLNEFVVGNNTSRPYTFWHSQSRRNLWGYKNPIMDDAFDRIRHASTDAEYRQAFRTFQIEGLDDPPAVFLALGEASRAVSKRFQVIAQPGSDILHTIADWRLAEQGKGAN